MASPVRPWKRALLPTPSARMPGFIMSPASVDEASVARFSFLMSPAPAHATYRLAPAPSSAMPLGCDSPALVPTPSPVMGPLAAEPASVATARVAASAVKSLPLNESLM